MLKPFLRSIKFKYLYHSAQWRASNVKQVPEFPVAFLIGCGRSGTTLAGRILSACPDICYHNEPYHYWVAIHEKSDVTNLLRIGPADYFLGDTDFSQDKSEVFRTLFAPPTENALVLEKTPHNVCRIGFLRQLVPTAKFLNIVRNGMMVCSSIKVAAQGTPYRILGKPNLNVWWGHNGSKWDALKRDCIEADYVTPEDASALVDDEQKAALEWIVSVEEFRNWKLKIPESCFEFCYQELVDNPEKCINAICQFLDLEESGDWIATFGQKLRPERDKVDIDIRLPDSLRERFNAIQEQYGFTGRAQSL